MDALSSCALAALRARAEAEREGPAQAAPGLYGWRERHARCVSEVAGGSAQPTVLIKEEEEKADMFDNESDPPPDIPEGMCEPI